MDVPAVALAILVPMAAIAFARTNVARWLRVERTMILFFAGVYVLNTAAELADMVGIITLHRPETRAVSLLSSSLAIWVTNVLAFGLVYWQIDRGGPYAKATGTQRKPRLAIPAAGVRGGSRPRLAAALRRLSVPRLQHSDRLQPDRRPAAHPAGEVADDARKHNLARYARRSSSESDQRHSVGMTSTCKI